jgi:hypothetical protein
MMNTAVILERIEEHTHHYLDELHPLSLEQLKLQPNENEWSLGQLYFHLVKTALNMQIVNVEKCLSQSANAVESAGEKTDAGEAVFKLGGFPPERIRVPASPQYTPEQPASKQQISDGMHAVLQRMKEIEPLIEDLSPRFTAMHPRLGALNAKEWFALIEMHYRHHLLQLERLKSFLNSTEIV